MLCYACLQQRVEALHAGQLLPGLRPPLKTGKECLEDAAGLGVAALGIPLVPVVPDAEFRVAGETVRDAGVP